MSLSGHVLDIEGGHNSNSSGFGDSTLKTTGSDSRSRTSSFVKIDASMLPAITSINDELPNLHDTDPDERKTALCFGSCCDVRLACIVVDCVYFFIVSVCLPVYIAGYSFLDIMESGASSIYSEDVYRTSAIVQLSMGIFFCLVGLLGAIKFQKHLVLATAIWYAIDAIIYLVFFNWLSGLSIALYSYPHAALFVALQKETMTPENYRETERYCCCCSNNRDDNDDESEE